MKHETPSLTELPTSHSDELRKRMTVYSIIMGLRVLSILIFLVVPGLWKIAPAIFAVFSSYFAVIIANAVGMFSKPVGKVQIPTRELE
ncbi:MAG TPA: DUF3099 domain-containing protein [Candidatus Agrococcus pullicola]|uniref:DUF3099 domain-containing protein n=1 Tax=Candidatus Agrococcus pullicola TaxID=2838429 RepID=A0A9D1YS81_9MICO|nr:DUF3099 domain-containing protein [Candidatus Agrococcus pullicola]